MHLPGYFSLREANKEANASKTSCLQLHHQDGISENYLDFFRSSSAIEFDFEKNQLRQTILKHETVFQHQLHELHRLYNTQRHMMNEIVRVEKPPHELSVGDFTFCFQRMTRFKNGECFDESNKCKKTRKRSMFDLEVPADRYLDGIGNDESTEVSVDTCDQNFPVHHKNNSGASVSWLTKSCLLNLNESLPDDERNPFRFNSHIETSAFSGRDEHKGRVFSRNFSEQGKLYGNSTESFGKKKIFGVEISKTNPSSNSCLKIFGIPVLENHHEPQDLPSSRCSSKSGSLASVLLCGTTSDKVEPLNTDHMLPKHEEKQSLDCFSDSLASVLSYGANFSKIESLNTDHEFQKQGVNQSVNGLAIDLNMCAEEEAEGVRIVSFTRNNDSRKLEIDLEAPVEVEPETSGAEFESFRDKPENESQHREEDSKVLAAETLLHISLSCINDSRANSDLLSWFADVISSQEAQRVRISHSKDFSLEDVDYFEYMTLKQPEITVEECDNILREDENPKPQNMYKNLRQRGPKRRGRKRQRKDFQRDVLPTLTSLSRKEAIDDLQAIEALITVAGEKWESGSMEKTGSGRGRTSLVCGEIGFEGWGRKTRRPPRQRCVNAPPVIASK